MLSFIINFILFSGIFYLSFSLLFKNRSFFQLNRILLWIIPVLSIGISWLAPHFKDPVYHSTGFSATLLPFSIEFTDPPSANSSYGRSFSIWHIIYFSGLAINLSLLIVNLSRIFRIISRSERASINNVALRYSQEVTNPFTFFNFIIIPSSLKNDPSLDIILKHENTHRLQKHSLDNLYYNLLGIVFWFNPFIHLLAREIRQAHECIADKVAVGETSHEVYVNMLLNRTFNTDVIPVPGTTNPFFNSSLIKSRITMLYKKENSGWLKASYLIILPLTAVMALHACNKVEEEKSGVTKTVSMGEVDQPPLFGNCETGMEKADMFQCFLTGMSSHISANIKYPEEAKNAGVSGKVYVAMTIDNNGNVSEVEVKRGIAFTDEKGKDYEPSLEQKKAAKAIEASATEVIRSLPRLQAARKDGKPVSISYVIPINYALS